jgi:hypothetical protein
MDTLEFTTVLAGLKRKFTGKSHDEIHRRLLAFLKDDSESAYWMNRITQASKPITPQSIKKGITLSDAWHAGMAIVKAATGDTADQGEHNRRAKICLTSGPNGSPCPKMTAISTCMACGGAGKLSRAINQVKKVISNPIVLNAQVKDKFCDECGCSLALLTVTHTSGIVESDEKNKARPKHCWIRRDSPNFKK